MWIVIDKVKVFKWSIGTDYWVNVLSYFKCRPFTLILYGAVTILFAIDLSPVYSYHLCFPLAWLYECLQVYLYTMKGRSREFVSEEIV